jgi:hypothetical protein
VEEAQEKAVQVAVKVVVVRVVVLAVARVVVAREGVMAVVEAVEMEGETGLGP